MTNASIIPLPPELGGTPREELAYRLRQQAIVSEFGLFALRCYDLPALFQRAVVLCARGMQTDFCKILEFDPAANRLVVRAGVGWAAGVVGTASVGADLESPSGFALRTGRAVISNHLAAETRFRTPTLLADHGIKRAVNVLIAAGPKDEPFGVLEVDSSSEGRFEEADVAFMQAFASLLGVAIERQWTEAARREQEEQASVIVEAAQDYAFVSVSPARVITGWGRGAELAFGYASDEIIGQPFDVLFTPEDRQAGVPGQELDRARALGISADDRWHRRKNGERFWVHGSTRPLHDTRGDLRGYLKVSRDETARRAEREALVVSEERTRMAVASAAIGTWDWKPLTADIQLDARCRALFGLAADAPLSPGDILAGLPPEHRLRLESAAASALDPSGEGSFNIDLPLAPGNDGGERWVMITGRCLFESGSPVRCLGTILDITDRKRAEERSQLLGREFSHRVKNSLTMVAGLLSLQIKAAGDERVSRVLGDARRRIMTIAEMHDHLWQQADAREVDLGVFLMELCRQIQETVPDHRITFSGEPTRIVTDRAIPMALVVNELVTNAAKYAYPGGGGEVRVALRPLDGSLRVEVSDSGCGLPPGFSPSKAAGSLGMRLVFTLARQLGTQPQFEINEPHGTRVVLDVPL